MKSYKKEFLLLVFGLLIWVGCQAETAVPIPNNPATEVVLESATATVAPTETPLRPTETAVPATQTITPTPIPPTITPMPTATATAEVKTVTAVSELVGYWEYDGIHSNGGGKLHYIYHFRADGILEVADSLSAMRAGEVKSQADFWFDGGIWHTQLVTGYWRNNTCFLGSGKPITGKYKIRPEEDGILRFFRMSDVCQVRNFSLSDNNATLTPLVIDDVDGYRDSETGYPLNPTDFPLDEPFVLVGTMLGIDTTDVEVSVVSLRVPSGEVVELNAPSLMAVQVVGEEDVDLIAYDPAYPLRARFLVQLQEDGSFLTIEMVVFTTLG